MRDSDTSTMERKDLEKLRKSVDRANIINEIKQIEARTKNRWLKKKIELFDLPDELENAIREIEKETGFKYLEGLKDYIQNIILLDWNVEHSNAVMVSIAVLLITTLSIFFSAAPEFIKNEWYTMGLIIILVISASLLISIPIRNKHRNYAREKTFYEIFLKVIEKLQKGE